MKDDKTRYMAKDSVHPGLLLLLTDSAGTMSSEYFVAFIKAGCSGQWITSYLPLGSAFATLCVCIDS